VPRQRDNSVERVLMVLLDLLALFLAANLAFDVRYGIDWRGIFGEVFKRGPAPWGELYQAMPYMLLGWFVIFAVFGLYRPGQRFREEIARLIKAQAVAFVVMFATAFFYRGFEYSRMAAVFMVPIAFVLTLGFRYFFRMAKEQLLKMRHVRERVLVVGRSEQTDRLFTRLLRADNPFELMGVLVDEGQEVPEGIKRLGAPRELGKILTRRDIDRVLLISGALSHQELTEAMNACLRHQVQWGVVPDLYDMLVDRLNVEEISGVPVMGPAGTNLVGMNLVLKRGVDFLLAALLLLVLSPLILLVAGLIKLTSRGPVLFVQKRVGRAGKAFSFYKFRSMYENNRDKTHRQFMEQVIKNGNGEQKRNGNGQVYKMKKDPRVTPVGRFIRRFSIDELPQLFNVLRGDMSLIGPRPAIPYEVRMYEERHRRRLQALPGITGLWQVSGRNQLSFEEMVELDIHYIENWSVGLDVRIFFKTIAAVIFTRGY
jgi:exopolysaccharide biosynthesis polyprenyl glycosylphosphotransferase